jgi:KipI family sensor histidine kinase inhibitor
MKILPYGDRAVLIDDISTAHRLSLQHHLHSSDDMLDVRLGMNSVVVIFDSASESLVDTITQLISDWNPSINYSATTHHDIDVIFDGEDLAVLTHQNLSREDIIRIITDTTFSVALMGFAPGFPYLVPESHHEFYNAFARRGTPRSAVPAGSVAIAAGMACIYPSTMPGGWNIVGRTMYPLFDAHNPHPATLAVGDTVRLWSVAP